MPVAVGDLGVQWGGRVGRAGQQGAKQRWMGLGLRQQVVGVKGAPISFNVANWYQMAANTFVVQKTFSNHRIARRFWNNLPGKAEGPKTTNKT